MKTVFKSSVIRLMMLCAGSLCCLNSPVWGIHFGEPTMPEEFSAVGIVKIHDLQGNELSIGTGTLISSDVVLTAAHVISEAQVPVSITFTVDKFPDRKIPAIAYRVHPGWGYKGILPEIARASDVALLKLANPFPEEIRPFKVTTRIPQLKSSVHVVGYGRDETLKQAGIRRKGSLIYQKKMASGWMLFGSNSEQFQRTDHGDSGGPLFIEENGEYKIVALVQGYDHYTQIKSLSSDEYGAYVSTAQHIDWIERKWQELGQVAAPPAKFCFIIRPVTKSDESVQPALSWQQVIGLISVDSPRVRDLLLSRGLCDWVEFSTAKKFADSGVIPGEQIFVIGGNQ